MSKAVLVMDMPSSCEKCRLHSFVGKDCDVLCEAEGKTQSYEDAYKGKPIWCPLKPMPEKKSEGETLKVAIENDCYDGTTEDKAYFNGYDKGYNACIDELLKGEEG